MTVSFENFPIYKKAISFTVKIFKILNNENLHKEFSLKDQLKRATLSISNNIAEGSEYGSNKQFIRFLWIAKGSCAEVRSMLFVLHSLEKIDSEIFNTLNDECLEITKEIYHFIKYLEKSTLDIK
ncbi:four helix bundle protein [Chryseobacterium aquaticum]|jgi:four helix bundle protein|uniref:Four helix bundle protein n=1 Tax=Chryseobacterium aquaticum TaxID=452084 RepID=A0A848MYB8_9FLAO|nr:MULTISPECIES: four helix bundle protein [Chryseobacterium]NMR33647.1 four helix bundle protein [Chryseobacterium aquaticum]NRQ45721.1 four helix bundle protein [Chryseobacterium sp. C-204]